MLPDVITCWRTDIYRIYLFSQTKYEVTEVLRLLLISQDSLDFFLWQLTVLYSIGLTFTVSSTLQVGGLSFCLL